MLKEMLKRLADNSRASSLANRIRRKRLDVFRDFIADLPKPVRILDVGGTERFWVQGALCDPDQIEVVLLNIELEPVSRPNFTSEVGDARDLSRYKDGEFDIVFSNSVIEHVGEFESQMQMASEIRRVGRWYFVQTPAKYFPIEPHFLFPFFSYLPTGAKVYLLTHFKLGWYPRLPSRAEAREFLRWFRLLTAGEVKKLFPGAKIHNERFLGLTKSYLAMGRRLV